MILDDLQYKQNLIERVHIHNGCVNEKIKQQAAMHLCTKEIRSFFKYWLWTYDPRLPVADRAFLLYDYQDGYVVELNNDIMNGESSLSEKSRDMGVTWMVLGVFLYRWLFFDENFLLGSRKEEYVDKLGDMDSHFERLRYMLSKLPDWMVKECGWDRRNSGHLKLFKYNGSSIVGESMSPNFSRQGRQKAILLDEFAFVEKAEQVWRACGDSAPCKVVVSTPNGKNNHFSRLRDSGKIKVKTLHWKLHPKKDATWYAAQIADRSEKDVAQELDINYTISTGTPFYKGFIRSFHLRKVIPNIERPLILSWDYGFNHPNCNISQIMTSGAWVLLDNVFGESELIDEFGDKVSEYLETTYPNHKIGLNYGDPAGRQRSDKSKKTSEKILRDKGFPVISAPSNLPWTNYAARKNIIERKLKMIIDSMPAIIVNDCENNEIIAEGFEGGYRYPDQNKYGGVSEKPADDGFFEHPFNCIEYAAVHLFKGLSTDKKIVKGEDTRTRLRRKYHRKSANAGFSYS